MYRLYCSASFPIESGAFYTRSFLYLARRCLRRIEIVSGEFYSGALGPSTIVGSAAFNLFCICGVCVYCIPAGETRAIADMGVFRVTSAASILAYVWLVVILMAWTPDIVTIVEAVITFLAFPVVVVMAYAADRNMFKRHSPVQPEGHMVSVTAGRSSAGGEDLLDEAELEKNLFKHAKAARRSVRRQSAGNKDDDDKKAAEFALAMAMAERRKFTRAHYRCNAIRDITGQASANRAYNPSPAAVEPFISSLPLFSTVPPLGNVKPLT